MRREPDQRAVEAEDRREEAVADARGIPGDRVEDALEVRGRDGDGAQDLGRGGLLIAGLPERPLPRLGLASRPRIGPAEGEEGTGDANHAHSQEEQDSHARIREAALREEGGGERAAGEGDARREARPGTNPGSREDGVARLRTGPAATWGCLGPVLMGRSSGPGPALGQSSPAASDAS